MKKNSISYTGLLIFSLFSICFSALNYNALAQQSRIRKNINMAWRFALGDPSGLPYTTTYNDSKWDLVSLPHSMEIFPANLNGFKEHGRNIGWYRRQLNIQESWKGKKVFLEFQGAMQTTRLWVNGVYAGEYAVTGYNSFHFDVTKFIKPGKNKIAVRVDNTSNPNIPPDSLKTDFIQFGGLYRDVFLVVTDPVHITFPWQEKNAGIRLTMPDVSEKMATVIAETAVRNDNASAGNYTVVTQICDNSGKVINVQKTTTLVPANTTVSLIQQAKLVNPKLWSINNPYLYKVNTIIVNAGRELDRVQTNLGVRWFSFDKNNGFFLNGKSVKLIGTNRHQTWPFIGNAVPNGLQQIDVDQMKATGYNWVRLSHYPYDPDFLDMLDKAGILALAEGPTWMFAGNTKWMDNLEKSFRSMLRRDRNHPSIVIWNACINHAKAEPRLVQAAHEEDPSRPRGQFEVPAIMRFRGAETYGALIIEHTGHLFPTSRGDKTEGLFYNREYELVKRHWIETNKSRMLKDNQGLAVWCMYDYNTFHNSLDAIARHGVFDLFRIPKYSYWWYQSELTTKPMAYAVRSAKDSVAVFSNAEQVRLSQDIGNGYQLVTTHNPDEGFALKHPPFHFKVSKNIHAVKAEALINGKVVAVNEWKKQGKAVALKLLTDRKEIIADGADISRIEVQAVDANGTAVDNCDEEVSFSIKGEGQLIGENNVKLRAGKMIILAQSAFKAGTIEISASSNDLKSASQIVKTVRPHSYMDIPFAISTIHPSRSKFTVTPQTVSSSGKDMSWFKFKSKLDVPLNTWIESDPIMVSDLSDFTKIEIDDAEYRIYSGEWTSKAGTVMPGDAVFLRIKSASKPNSLSSATVKIGEMKAMFQVSTK